MSGEVRQLGVATSEGVYEVMSATPMDLAVKQRLSRMAHRARKRGEKLYIVREGGRWGIASRRLESLAKIYEDEPHDGFYEVSPRWHDDIRRTPDLFLQPVPPPRPETE